MSKLACGETYHILLQCRAEKTGLGGRGSEDMCGICKPLYRFLQHIPLRGTQHNTAIRERERGGGQRRTIYHVFLFPPSGVNNTLPDANGKKQIRLEGSRAMHDWR